MSSFRDVSFDGFRREYFRHAGRDSGWTAEHWQSQFEERPHQGWRFLVEPPRSRSHDRMWIVSDPTQREHRMFFMTDDADEAFFDHPGRE